MTKLNPETRDKLKGVSTATLASALYKRGLRNQMVQDVRPLGSPKGTSMVGEAYTLRYMPAREDLNPMTIFRDHSHPQRRAVEECPPGAILVMDSRQRSACSLGRRNPGNPADGARSCRRGNRWRLSRFSRDRTA
jgi:regulator of RNase E activity RraA